MNPGGIVNASSARKKNDFLYASSTRTCCYTCIDDIMIHTASGQSIRTGAPRAVSSTQILCLSHNITVAHTVTPLIYNYVRLHEERARDTVTVQELQPALEMVIPLWSAVA